MKKNNNNRSGSPVKTIRVRKMTDAELAIRKKKRKRKSLMSNRRFNLITKQKVTELQIIHVLMMYDAMGWKLVRKNQSNIAQRMTGRKILAR